MRLDKMNVAIIGAGIGGLTAALCLRKAGANVRVYERAPKIEEVGAGIQLGPNATRILRDLDLGEGLAKIASFPDRVDLFDALNGQQITYVPMGKTMRDRYGAPYASVHRADLHGLLFEEAQKRGAEIIVDAEVSQLETHGRFQMQGKTVEADLIIAADGVSSFIREQVSPNTRPSFAGAIAWRAVVPLEKDDPKTVQLFLAPNRHCVLYPLENKKLLNIVGVTEETTREGEGWRQEADPFELQKRFSDCAPLEPYLKRVEKLRKWGLFDHQILPRWSEKRVVLLGDACHPMLPFMAQGAAMAIEDAAVLAKALVIFDDYREAFAHYQDQRAARVDRVYRTARANKRNYHLKTAFTRKIGFTGLNWVGRINPALLLKQFDWIYGYEID